jgi:hypothetical protein
LFLHYPDDHPASSGSQEGQDFLVGKRAFQSYNQTFTSSMQIDPFLAMGAKGGEGLFSFDILYY